MSPVEPRLNPEGRGPDSVPVLGIGIAPDIAIKGGRVARIKRGQALCVMALGSWLLITMLLVTIVTWKHPRLRATIGMGWGLILLWVVLGGTLMRRCRESIRATVLPLKLDWRLKFILLSTALVLIEEAITTSMTNLAPLFGVNIGEAYITASTNYFDVIGLHSVVVIVPMFVGWALILSRYDFSPFEVFLLFGMTGTLAECSFGWNHLSEFAMWIFIYGLMVYLPSYCVPTERKKRPPRWYHYPLAIAVTFLFIPIVPLPLVAGLLFPHHPRIHFPPIAAS
ncbi:MAG TPA: hypothetical protein VL361_06885 [Candidatus Limnocylindrales bacterium]|nr:hypothetical protein [Candidatus Limnocylindrales bacterium]